jgi:flagellar biosynthesis protein FlhF
MHVRLYRAPAIPAAMEQVRRELGADALILATRRIADGVEVTAAVEAAVEPPPPAIDARRRAAFEYHRLPPGIARKLETGPLPFALSAVFRFVRLTFGPRPRPLLLVGPPGGGKTLTVARLAARLVVNGVRPLVMSADDRRAGAIEQLSAFTGVLGLGLVATSDPIELKAALAEREDNVPVLIDAPGLNAFEARERDELAILAEITNSTVALVLPAGIDAAEAADLAAAHAAGGATLLVATRLDLARRLSGVLTAAAVGLALAEAGIGPGIADGLTPLTPSFLAERLLRIPPNPERHP